uniref:Uncharacterized protein n=1 Tax=Triticum urartu TaxID=4572 RepID=A0A8R7P666_TRIUA
MIVLSNGINMIVFLNKCYTQTPCMPHMLRLYCLISHK